MKISRLIKCLLYAISFLSHDALAGTLSLHNGAGRQLCIAVGENQFVDFQIGILFKGWACINDGESLDLNLTSDIKVAIREITGVNYLTGSRATRFPATELYVPSEVTANFGLNITMAEYGFSYTYHIGPSAWSDGRTVSDFTDLETLLAGRGFVLVNGWTFSSSIYAGGLGLVLNE